MVVFDNAMVFVTEFFNESYSCPLYFENNNIRKNKTTKIIIKTTTVSNSIAAFLVFIKEN